MSHHYKDKGMDLIINIFSLVGSLALFLFGMKTMSEGLEKFAGDRLRSILAAMTKNRVMGVLTGILITALIQSSSATTVMVVSFVNAGLMTLGQSIGVIMGANIGTTVTAWIISAVGFKVNIAAFAIPLLAIGMPLIFSSKGNRKSIGEFVFGFSFLFMGLAFLQEAATAMNIGDMVAGMLAHVPQDSFLTILLFVIVGALEEMMKRIDLTAPRTNITKSINIEHEINNYRKQLRNQNLSDVNAGLYSYQLGVFYVDFISECERLADYVMNVVQAGKGLSDDFGDRPRNGQG